MSVETVQAQTVQPQTTQAQTRPAGPPPVTGETLLGMMTAFKSTAVLRACVDLKLFDALADGPRDATALAARLGADPRGLRALLDAAAGVGLLTRGDGRYDLPPGAAHLLVTTEPSYRGGITRVAASDLEWTALGNLAASVRGAGPVADLLAPDLPYWSDFAEHTTFITKALATLVADAVDAGAEESTSGNDSRPVGTILDVGCGHGLLGFELLRRHPDARLHAQDWPSVLDVAATHAERLGVADRTAFLPGDAFIADLGGPYDAVLVGNLLFHLSRDRAETLLDRLVGVLAPGGRIVVAGFTTGDAPAHEETHAALLGLLMLTATPGGQMYSTADYGEMFVRRGLTGIEVLSRPGLAPRAVVATAPVSAAA